VVICTVKRYLITSALPYASGITHLGNVVGSTLPADIYARYCRLRGRDTLYVCGSDEHGVAITIAAEKEGISPRELIDRYHEANKNALAGIGIAFDIYDRTSNPVHTETAQEFFRIWQQQGLLVERDEEQFYDADASMFLPDRYVEGICPNCGYDKARGDQCDNCGAYYNQLDLKNPRSLVSGRTPEVRTTRHWYFRLDAFQEWTEAYIEAHAGIWKDNVLQQSRSWLKQGLSERAATRDMQWGIPVPVDGAAGKVLYVWFEAVLGYISATKQWALEQGNADDWKRWWCHPDTVYTAFLGKDNIVFHTIIFPILLHSRASEGYVLPAQVPANEFLNLEGRKFSKSRNWAIDLLQYKERFPEPEHSDMLRYVLTMNMPETKDSDFTWKDFQARVNNELASILGNFVNRVLQFTHRTTGGIVPALPAEAQPGDHERDLLQAVHTGMEAIARNYDRFRFRDAATETMNLARAANKYFNDKAPWKTVKEDRADCDLTLNMCLQMVRTLSVAIAPILPHTAVSMQRMLGLQAMDGAPGPTGVGIDHWLKGASFTLAANTTLTEPVILFSRVEDDVVAAQIAALEAGAPVPEESSQQAPAEQSATAAPAAQPPEAEDGTVDAERISIDDFMKVELRTAVVLEAEAVPKSKKLLKLIVDLGTERRQILAGIAQHYSPEQLIGTTIVVVANLKPATLMGMESQGMVLAASNADGLLSLVRPVDAPIGPGGLVK
jgi:methionyl-tRNA synthetase